MVTMRSSVPALPNAHIEHEESQGIEVRQALSILWRRRLILVIGFVILFAMGRGIIELLPERYTAEVALILDMARAKAVDVKSADDQVILDRAIINSEM